MLEHRVIKYTALPGRGHNHTHGPCHGHGGAGPRRRSLSNPCFLFKKPLVHEEARNRGTNICASKLLPNCFRWVPVGQNSSSNLLLASSEAM